MMLSFIKRDSVSEESHDEVRGSGLVAGTRVATAIGWRPVEAIVPGDTVLTFDEGLMPVTRVTRTVLWSDPESCPRHLLPLRVPAGALGNQSEMMLLPEQPVMLESDTAEEIFGDPFSLMPAQALEGLRGIARFKPAERVEVVSLCFEQDQVVFANVGALFFCPRVLCGEVRSYAPSDDDSPYVPLSLDAAEALALIVEVDEAREPVT